MDRGLIHSYTLIAVFRGKLTKFLDGKNEFFRTFTMTNVNLCEIYVKQTQVYGDITIYLDEDSEKLKKKKKIRNC